MTSNLQLISFLVSFIFGFFFYFLTNFNFEIIKDLKVYLKHIITFIYVIDMVIIYVIISCSVSFFESMTILLKPSFKGTTSTKAPFSKTLTGFSFIVNTEPGFVFPTKNVDSALI